MKFLVPFFAFLITLMSFLPAQAQRTEVLDKIVAQVNDHVILKSDIDQAVFEYMRSVGMRNFDEILWYQILESQIDKYVLIEKARRDSIVVSDEQVNRQLDQRIRMLTQQAGSEQELERALGQSLVQIRAEYRETFREDMMVQQVRESKIRSISITRPEVIEFFHQIPTDSLPMIPESVELAQIVITPPPSGMAKENARNLALALRDSILNHNRPLEALARRYSDGPTASRGGSLPLLSTSDLLPAYSAAAAALEPGELSEVVETIQGFQVIRLDERRGDQIRTSHILISIKEDELDTDFAISKLRAIRDSVLVYNKPFATMARRHSEDRQTAPMGGRLIDPQTGQRRIPVEQLDPNLFRVSLLLENEGDVSEPRSFRPRGSTQGQAWRIVQLRKRIPEHRANLELDYDLIAQFALQFKQQRELFRWMEQLRSEVYIKYFIEVPGRQDVAMPDFSAPPEPVDVTM